MKLRVMAPNKVTFSITTISIKKISIKSLAVLLSVVILPSVIPQCVVGLSVVAPSYYHIVIIKNSISKAFWLLQSKIFFGGKKTRTILKKALKMKLFIAVICIKELQVYMVFYCCHFHPSPIFSIKSKSEEVLFAALKRFA
jgi:hypothetical protein